MICKKTFQVSSSYGLDSIKMEWNTFINAFLFLMWDIWQAVDGLSDLQLYNKKYTLSNKEMTMTDNFFARKKESTMSQLSQL